VSEPVYKLRIELEHIQPLIWRRLAEFLEIIADKSHPEHASMHRWARSIKGLKRRFDPEHFDEREVRFSDPKGAGPRSGRFAPRPLT
jgi:hypothetical protein